MAPSLSLNIANQVRHSHIDQIIASTNQQDKKNGYASNVRGSIDKTTGKGGATGNSAEGGRQMQSSFDEHHKSRRRYNGIEGRHPLSQSHQITSASSAVVSQIEPTTKKRS